MATKEYTTSWNIIKEIAILNESKSGWRKELNLISWNGNPPKFDIRWWSPDKQNIGKGLTLTEEELSYLYEIIPTEKTTEGR